MSKRFDLYVPGDCTFQGHFYPRLKRDGLEAFEAATHRWGIQRRENNHLVVFLERSLRMEPDRFTHGEEIGRFALMTDPEKAVFRKLLGGEKEVAVFTLFYTPRMTPLAWRVMVAIIDDPRTLVMDEARQFSTGHDCALELKGLMI